MITLTSLSPLASTTALISSKTKASFPAFKAPTLITISISSAPFAIASLVSKALTAEVFAPKGKPITVQTLTSLSFRLSAANETHVGFTQTLAKSYSFASDRIFSTCSCSVSGFKIV